MCSQIDISDCTHHTYIHTIFIALAKKSAFLMRQSYKRILLSQSVK